MTKVRLWRCLAVLMLAACLPAQAVEPVLVSLKTPRGATVSFLLLKPDHPVASVILFAGDHGALGLVGAEEMHWGYGNFLVRTRASFAAQDLAVAVVDTPSDRPDGMDPDFRTSADHVADISALATHLKMGFGKPVWVIGTSMGTYSAAAAAISGHDIAGLVLSSTITHGGGEGLGRQPDGVASLPLAAVKVPTLILSHRDDGCPSTPPSGAETLRQRLSGAPIVAVEQVQGGKPGRGSPCTGSSPHGFYGAEDDAVGRIVAFVKIHSTD